MLIYLENNCDIHTNIYIYIYIYIYLLLNMKLFKALWLSVLRPTIFLIYLNGLNHAIKYCKVHHFADDTNLLHFWQFNQKW